MIERECDRPFGYLGERAIALSENKGDSLRDSYARAYFEKATITLRPRHYQTALRYCVTGFKSMSSLEVSILNK